MHALAAPDSLEAPWFTSTGDVRAMVSQLNTATDVLNNDITRSWYPASAKSQPENDFVNGWILWRDQTYAWIKTFYGYVTWLAWNQYDIAAAKIQELIEWRASFEKIAGRSATGPAPTLPPGAKPIDLEGIVKTVAIVAAIGGVVYFGAKLYIANKAKQAVFGDAPAPLSRKKLEAAAWAKTHRDYKSRGADGVRRVLHRDPASGKTGLWPLAQLSDEELRQVARL